MRRFQLSICAFGMALGMTMNAGAQAPADAPSASELLAKIDGNQAFSSIEYSARMEIRIGKQLRVKSMKAWALNDKKAFLEFTNPEDYGTRMLKLEKELWMYFPKEQDTVRISGHLLKEGLMGSDLSYEDALESDELSTMYQASVSGEAQVDGRRAFVVELKAKTPQAKYDRRILWVDAERFV
ncbi:MAG: outer membrane lipoprotein-sorting protein, partial [Spirochaetia bacterium]|nr:outer membrane lipoprotein-sorting protein [Spirochaetia bacterium]